MAPQVCARCQETTSEPAIAAIAHSASVGGHTVYACPGKCAASFPKQHDPFHRTPITRPADPDTRDDQPRARP